MCKREKSVCDCIGVCVCVTMQNIKAPPTSAVCLSVLKSERVKGEARLMEEEDEEEERKGGHILGTNGGRCD